MKNKLWANYKNGNYMVYINTMNGTKIRETEEDEFLASFPECMDLKITNQCNMGCVMCHEDSTTDGKHGDLNIEFINTLNPYTELALGGGNPEKKISIYSFLSGDNECSSKAFIKSVDVNDLTVWTKGSNIIHTDKYNVNVEFETNYIKSREIKGENNGIAFTVDGYKFNTFRILPQGCTSDNNKLSISKNSKGIVLVIYEYKIETSFKPVTIESKEDWHIHEVVEQQVSNILNEYYTVK